MRPNPFRLGVDARAASEVRAGRGVYVRELARALLALDEQVEPVLYGREPWPLPGSRFVSVRARDPIWSARAGLQAARECDAVLAANSFLMAAVAGKASVAVVHDLFGFSRSFGAPAGGLGERATLPLAARRAAGFICVSDATRADLVARYPALDSRAVAIPLGVGERFLGLGGEYVLAVGTREPRKNLARLIEAFAGLPRELRERFRLAVAGAQGWDESQAHASADERVVMLGFVDDADLPSLYAGASVFAFPSLGEGFGLPVLEAMAAGTPVLTSDRSSLPEVAGDAALLVDPTAISSIRAGLARLLADSGLRSDLAARGRGRAATFTWERTARATLDYLTSVTSTFEAGKSRARKVSS